MAFLKAAHASAGDELGASVAVSADGSVVVVGARGESSGARGVGGDQSDESASRSGAAFVFRREGGAYRQEAYLKAARADAGDELGYRVAISGDGETIAVGALEEGGGGGALGEDDESAPRSGAVYVFHRTAGATWTQEAYVKASGAGAGDYFSESLALSADGKVLAVGAVKESSSAQGIGGNETNNDAEWSGAVYVFARAAGTGGASAWTQQAYVKSSTSRARDLFGWSVALSADGSRMVVGAPGDSRDAAGAVDLTLMESSGAAFVFDRAGSDWSEKQRIKGQGTSANARFGGAVALSASGETLAVGAFGAFGTEGASYVYDVSAGAFTQRAYLTAPVPELGACFGWSVSLSGDGRQLAVSAYGDGAGSKGVDGVDGAPLASSGAVHVYERDAAGAFPRSHFVKAVNAGAGDLFGWSTALSADGFTLVVGAPYEGSPAGGEGTDDSAPSSGAAYVYARQ